MSRTERLTKDFKVCRGPFPYKDLVRLLVHLDFEEKTSGDGSVIKFLNKKTNRIINFHSPHPSKEIPLYLVKQIRKSLIEQKLI